MSLVSEPSVDAAAAALPLNTAREPASPAAQPPDHPSIHPPDIGLSSSSSIQLVRLNDCRR